MVFSFICTSKKRRRCRTNPASFVAKIQISEQRTKGKIIFLCYFPNITSSVATIVGLRFLHKGRNDKGSVLVMTGCECYLDQRGEIPRLRSGWQREGHMASRPPSYFCPSRLVRYCRQRRKVVWLKFPLYIRNPPLPSALGKGVFCWKNGKMN